MIARDLAQLRQLYRGSWETLVANTRVKQAFGIADDFTSDYLSRLTGQTTVRTESQNRSRGSSSGSGFFGRSQSGTAEFGRSQPPPAALVSLELAVLLLEEGRTVPVVTMAVEMV